jgi:hypothetical protein
MSPWLKHELKSVAMATAFFAAWIGVFILQKTLILAEYQIGFIGWSKALTGALILGKVALILEKVPLGKWVRAQPAWVAVVSRTTLYSAGVVVVLLIERGVEGSSEHGGFVGALRASWQDAAGAHLAANAICISGALLVFNLLAVWRQYVRPEGLLSVLLRPLPEPPAADRGDADLVGHSGQGPGD